MNELNTKVPRHLWIVGVLAVLWNAGGAFDYSASQLRIESYMSQFTPEQLEYFYGLPAWVVAAWAIAVWSSLLGSLGLKDLLHALLPDYLRLGSTHYQGSSQDISALAVLWQEDCAEQCRQAHRILARDHVSPVPATIDAAIGHRIAAANLSDLAAMATSRWRRPPSCLPPPRSISCRWSKASG